MSRRFSFVVSFEGDFEKLFALDSLMEVLRNHGHQIQVVICALKETEEIDRWVNRRNDFSKVYCSFDLDLFSGYKVAGRLKKFRPDLIHCWDASARRLSRIARFFFPAKQWIVPVWEDQKLRPLQKYFDRFFPISRARKLEASEFYSSGDCLPVPFLNQYSVDLESVKKTIEDKISESKNLSKDVRYRAGERSKDVTQLLAIGSNDNWKQIKDVIWALDLIDCVDDSVVLTVVGDSEVLHELQLFARQANVFEKVRFVGSVEDPVKWIMATDIFVCADHYSGYSYYSMVASYCGVPVLLSDRPSHRKVFADRRQVVFFPAGDRAELARCVLDELKRADSVGELTACE